MRLSKFFGLDENNFKVCKAGDRVLITGVTDTSYVAATVVKHPTYDLLTLISEKDVETETIHWLPMGATLDDFRNMYGEVLLVQNNMTLRSGTIVASLDGKICCVQRHYHAQWCLIPLRGDDSPATYTIQCADNKLDAFNTYRLLGALDNWCTCSITNDWE